MRHLQTICALTLVFLLAGCNPQPSAETSQSTTTTVSTATAKRQDVVGYKYFDGKLVIPPSAQASAYSPYDTPVQAVNIRVGQYVEHGQQIIRLNIPGTDQAAEQAKVDLSTAKQSYSAQKEDNSGQVKQAQQALDQAKSDLQTAKDTVASGGTADVDAATQEVQQAEQNLATAKQQLNETLQPTKQALAESAAELAAVRADARKGIVRAPISGTVISVQATPGTQAQSNQTLATIIDYAKVEVQGIVPPDMKDLVTRGSSVIIAFNGTDSTPVEGDVTDVSVIPPSPGQPSPGYTATIRFDNPREVAEAGTSGASRIGVRTGSVKNALVVPVGAVYQQDGRSYVNVQNGSNWVATPVETGLSDGAVMEIKSGLSDGAVVEVKGQPTSS